MIEKMIWVAGIFLLSGVFWYCIFYQKEKRLLNRLQQMLDHAIDGELERTEISEEKYSALENSMKPINEQIQNIAQKKDTLCRRMYN